MFKNSIDTSIDVGIKCLKHDFDWDWPDSQTNVRRHGGREGRDSNGTVVEEMLHAVSQHLARNLSSPADVQGLEGMAQAIRYVRVGWRGCLCL